MKDKKSKNFIREEEKKIKKEWRKVIFNLLFLVATILTVAFFYENILLTLILGTAIAVIGLLKWKSWVTFGIFLLGFFLGPASEIFCIHFGAWNYPINNFLSVPSWLFIIWGNASAFLYEMGKEIHKLGVKK